MVPQTAGGFIEIGVGGDIGRGCSDVDRNGCRCIWETREKEQKRIYWRVCVCDWSKKGAFVREGERVETTKMSAQSAITDTTNLISVEMLRNALYSKWCNLAGKSMTQESSLTARRILESKKGKYKINISSHFMNMITFRCSVYRRYADSADGLVISPWNGGRT